MGCCCFLSSSPRGRALIADTVACRSTQADETNVWLELWGWHGCWIAMLSVLNDSWWWETLTIRLGVKYKVNSPYGPYTLLALPHTPPMWKTKGLLGLWWGCSWSHGVTDSLCLISITAVIRKVEEETALSDTHRAQYLWEQGLRCMNSKEIQWVQYTCT